MEILRRIFCVWVIVSFAATSIVPPYARAQSVTSGLSFALPTPGIRVNLSPVFEPVLIKGLKVHPENPFKFDFIVERGDERLSPEAFQRVSQRMVNYFLAALTMPEKDLWVNLSPAEKNRIIPDALIKTELGRDLLAEDYILKQVSSSLLYPESTFGRAFWGKVYQEAYRKFGVTEVPVNVVNKIWILPDKASVFEKGNTVYIVNARLKVMLEEDFLAQNLLNRKIAANGPAPVPVKDLSRQILREVVVPAVEKEVNEGKNFAQLRQVYYALILAQWYQDVFKKSLLNKIYAGQKKVAGIDISDPKNRELIYRQYISAYKKGVFNYIREETDVVSQQPVPRKYFSGGVVFGRRVARDVVDEAMVAPRSDAAELTVEVKPTSQIESASSWYSRNRPKDLAKELRGTIKRDGTYDRPKLYAFLDKLLAQVESESLGPDYNPGWEGAGPALKAVTQLSAQEETGLDEAILDHYPQGQTRPKLIDEILLMNDLFARDQEIRDWVKERAPHLVGRKVYMLAAEIHHWAGGLGPVMKFLAKGLKELGVDVEFIEVRYQYGINGTVLKSRFDEIPRGQAILTEGIGSGIIQEVSRTEVKPNTRRTLQKYQIEKVGLNWDYVAGILTKNGWAESVGQAELRLIANLNEVAGKISTAFGGGESFGKIFRVLQRSDNVISETAVTELAGEKNRGKLWDILKNPLDYTSPNIGITDIKEDVDHFILEMGDMMWNGHVVPQAFSAKPQIQARIWKELRQNGYISAVGRILKLEEEYANFLPNRPDSKEKQQMFDTLRRVRDKGIHQVWVQVDEGIDENGIKVHMFRDVLPDGISSYYTKMLYNYKGRNNSVSKEESMAFINTASREMLKRLETKRKAEQADWKPAVVHTNDGQFAPLQAVTLSKYGNDDVIKDIYWHFTTHTYRNRGDNRDVHWTINTFVKHMMGVQDRFVNAFRNTRPGPNGTTEEYIDYSSPGVRLANSSNGVAFKHAKDVGKKDPFAILYAIANAAARQDMAKYYIRAFKQLFPNADSQRPTPQQLNRVKALTKQWFNQQKIRTANGGDGTFGRFMITKVFAGGEAIANKLIEKGVVEAIAGTNDLRIKLEENQTDIDSKKDLVRQIVSENGGNALDAQKIWGILQRALGFVYADQDSPLLGNARRLVFEKAGRGGYREVDGRYVPDRQNPPRAFSDANIWMLVKLGFNVVIMGNHQGTGESQTLAAGTTDEYGNYVPGLRALEKAIQEEKKSERAAQYPGSFQFVQAFTPEEKRYFFAAEDVDVKDSDNHTGANEQTEEDGPANGAIQAGPNYNGEGEGAIIAQGMEIDYGRPGTGQTAIPKEDTAKSWLETVFIPLSDLWKTNRMGFRQNQALSPRLDRIQDFKIVAASYAGLYENGLERVESQSKVDKELQAAIIQALAREPGTLSAILHNGYNGVGTFGFRIEDKGEFHQVAKGLVGFVDEQEKLENAFGYDSLLGHYINSDFQNHLIGTKEKPGVLYNTPAAVLLNQEFTDIANSQDSTLQKNTRAGLFVREVTRGMQARADAAMKAPGGIKLDSIPIERQGQLSTEIVSDRALESLYAGARGFYAQIVGITPIPNLLGFLK